MSASRRTSPMLSRPRPLAFVGLLGLVLGLGIGTLACDRKWDFECTAVWTDDGKEVWRKVLTYPEMETETAATARCKEDMLEARPRGANAAVCECKGIE